MNKIFDFIKKYNILILIILGFLLYFPALFYDFISDDNSLLLANQYINGRFSVHFFDFFKPNFVMNLIYTPLTFIICWGIIKIFGISSLVFHFVNIFFYVLSSIFLYYLLNKIINNYLVSFFAVILYIIHPCHIENTAWISGMGYNISALFFFLSFLYFILAFDENKKLNYVYSVIFYILAILSQPIAVTLPAILFLWVYCFRKEKLKEFILYVLGYLPFLFVYLFLYRQTVLYNHRFVSVKYNILEKFSILGFNIFNSFIPIHLCPIQSIPSLYYIVPLIVFFLFIYLFRNNKLYLFFFCFIIISLFPYSNIFFFMEIPVADRYLLLTTVSSCIFISYFIFYVLEKLKEKILLKNVSMFFFFLLYIFSFICYLPVYENNKTLFSYTYNININNHDIPALYSKIFYSKILIEDNKYDDALIVINKMIEDGKTYFDADIYGMKIVILMNTNRIEEALKVSFEMQKMYPNEFKTYLYLFDIYMLLKKYDKALEVFSIAEEKCKNNNLYKNNNLFVFATKKIKLDFVLANPDGFIESLKIISNNFTLLGDNGAFSKILEKNDYQSREEICLNCLKKYNNRYSQSLIFLLSCLYMNETYKNDASEVMKFILNNMDKAQEFVNKGDTNSAEKIYLSVISKNKYMYQAYYNLGFLYMQSNKREKAKDIFSKILNINPNDEQIRKIYNSL